MKNKTHSILKSTHSSKIKNNENSETLIQNKIDFYFSVI